MPASLEGAIELVTFPQGHVLFRQGDAGNAAYIVNSGSVGICREQGGKKMLLATIRKGELFGEMAVIDGSPRMATAFAITECSLTVISAGNIHEKIAKIDPFVRALIQMLINNLRGVHDLYAPKSRSVLDSVNTIAAQREALQGFLANNPNANVKAALGPKIKALDALVQDLRRIVTDHLEDDQRDDAMPQSVLTSTPRAAAGGARAGKKSPPPGGPR